MIGSTSLLLAYYRSSSDTPAASPGESSMAQDVPGDQFYPIWWENFEGEGGEADEGTDEVWDGGFQGATLRHQSMTTLQSDAPPPAGAPTSWRDQCLRLTKPSLAEDARAAAYLSHTSLPRTSHYSLSFEMYLADSTALKGYPLNMPIVVLREGGEHRMTVALSAYLSVPRLVFVIRYDGGSHSYQVPIETETFYSVEVNWSVEDQAWSVLLNGAVPE